MKLSNKILIIFFGLILFYMIAVFAEIRLKGDLHILDDSNSTVETVELEEFSYLILPEMDHRIDVIGSDKARLEVRSPSVGLLQALRYELTGDTLTLFPPDLEENQRIKISVYVAKNHFKGISATGPGMRIDSLDQEVLSITQNSGWINLTGSNDLHRLNINASNNATFKIGDLQLDQLKVQLDSSRVTSEAPVRFLEGSMIHDSYLYLSGNDEINFKKDKTSRLILE